MDCGAIWGLSTSPCVEDSYSGLVNSSLLAMRYPQSEYVFSESRRVSRSLSQFPMKVPYWQLRGHKK